MTINVERLLAHPALEQTYSFSSRDNMLHGLATGLGMDPLDPAQLAFVHDDNPDGFHAVPTLACVLGWVDFVRDPRSRDPGLGIDPEAFVVAQTTLALTVPLPTEGRGMSRSFFAAVIDGGPGRHARVCVRRDVLASSGVKIATVDTWLHVHGGGGFGGPSKGGPAAVVIPSQPPDFVKLMPTPPHLALLYRLALGDHNALHADPGHAQRLGFPAPILHGLATFSIAIHAALLSSPKGAVPALRAVAAAQANQRRPVFPGDTLKVSGWRVEDQIIFQVYSVKRDEVVLDLGCLSFRS